MTETSRTKLTLRTHPVWFEPTGARDDDLARLRNLIFDTHETDPLIDSQAQLRNTTLDGVRRAYGRGLATYPSIHAFVDACRRLSEPANDPPGTLADLYCQDRARVMSRQLPALPKLDPPRFRSELRRLKFRRHRLTGADTVCVVRNSAVWADGLGDEVVLGFTATSPGGDRYSVLIRSLEPGATGDQLMRALSSACDGQAIPSYTQLRDVTYFAVGGGLGGLPIVKSCLVLAQLIAQGHAVHGTWLATGGEDAGMHKAVAVLATGELRCTQYEPGAFTRRRWRWLR